MGHVVTGYDEDCEAIGYYTKLSETEWNKVVEDINGSAYEVLWHCNGRLGNLEFIDWSSGGFECVRAIDIKELKPHMIKVLLHHPKVEKITR